MFSRLVLLLGAVIAAYISYSTMVNPQEAVSDFGLMIDSADGRNEIRGQYGGFFGAVALVMVLSLFRLLPVRFGLGLLLVTVGGVLVGRLASLVFEGPAIFTEYSTSIQTYYAVDIILVLLTLIALLRNRT